MSGAIEGSTFRGFGTTVGIWTTEASIAAELDEFLRRWVLRVEAGCNRFRDDSDISRANANAGTAVHVGSELIAATMAACRMATLTGGLYDPTLGEAVIGAGYDRSFDLITEAGPGPALDPGRSGAWAAVEADVEASTVTVPEGYRLDLGGSAKGWAVDTALERLSLEVLPAYPTTGICISAGGDLAVAGAAPEAGWPVTIRERLDVAAGGTEAVVRLHRGAMATSGSTFRQWTREGRDGHHIIDPRTGDPGSSPWALVTTFADTCLEADTTATAAWLLGPAAPDQLVSWGVGARLMDHDGEVTLVGDLARWI